MICPSDRNFRRNFMAKKVLVIDDDPDILDSVKAILEANGYQVVTAQSGEEGVNAFKNDNPDLILCDMMMESVDQGAKVAQKIRETNKTIPVFLLSSIGDATSTNVDPGSMGFNGVFQKPVNPDSLVASVKKALGE